MDSETTDQAISNLPATAQDEPLTAALKAKIHDVHPADSKGRTYFELIAQSMINKAIAGDMRVALEIMKRVAPRAEDAVDSEPVPLGSADENSQRIRTLLRGTHGETEKQKKNE